MRARRVDIRQVMSAILTLSMFAMLMNMIKRDHFDYVEYTRGPAVEYQTLEIRETSSVIRRPEANRERLMEEKKIQLLEHCWKNSAPKMRPQPKGYVIFTLTNGPGYHMLQVANAVVVAKYLGAKLLLPDIMGKKPEERRNFSDIYDDQKFVNSLKGVVEVARNQPIEDSGRKPPIVRVPSMVSEVYIEAHIKPLLHQYGSLRMSTYFPSTNTWKTGATEHLELDPTACLAMFGVLQLQPHVRGIVDGMMQRLVKSGDGPKAKIIAVDLRDGILHSRSCRREGGINFCDVKVVGEFLRKAGFGPETAIYIAHSRWQDNLDPLRDLFPRTFTKELLNPRNIKQNLFLKRDSELRKVIDFVMCLESDVYVPITKDLLSTNVAAARIASGRTQTLFPAEI